MNPLRDDRILVWQVAVWFAGIVVILVGFDNFGLAGTPRAGWPGAAWSVVWFVVCFVVDEVLFDRWFRRQRRGDDET